MELAYFILENARTVEFTILGLFGVLCAGIIWSTTRGAK